MYTDLLGLTTAGAILVPTARGAALAQGCHDVLSVLGVMFRSTGMGEAFGYAVVLDAHRVKMLHGFQMKVAISGRCSGGAVQGYPMVQFRST